jgi:hypothetical protein
VRLLDEESLLACAAYVDLNPIRAALAETLETSDFTSVQRRIRSLLDDEKAPSPVADSTVVSPDAAGLPSTTAQSQCEPTSIPAPAQADSECDPSTSLFLSPLELERRPDAIGPCPSATGHHCSDKGFLAMSLGEYLELLDWTVRQQHVDVKRGATPENVPPIFSRLTVRPEVWCELARDFGRLFGVIAGQPHRIDEHRSCRHQRQYRIPRSTRELLSDG